MGRINKNYIITILCIGIVVLTVVYAAFSTNLDITAQGNISSVWKVRFTNISIVSSSGATELERPNIDGTFATFNVGLKAPGNYILYAVTIKNDGTIPAIITGINKSDTGSSALTYTVTGIEKYDTLDAGQSVTFNVRVEYDLSVTTPPANTSKRLSLFVDIGQNLYATQDNSITTSLQTISSDPTSNEMTS